MAWFWCKEKYLLFKRRAWPFWEGIVEMRCRDGSWQVSVRSFRAGRCSPLASTSNEVGAPLVARRKPRLPARYWLVRSYVIPPSRLVRPCRWAPEGSTRRPLVENDVFGPAAWFSRVGGPPKEALGGHQQSWRSLRARGRQRQSVPVRTSWRSCRWTRCVFAGGASSVAITCVSAAAARGPFYTLDPILVAEPSVGLRRFGSQDSASVVVPMPANTQCRRRDRRGVDCESLAPRRRHCLHLRHLVILHVGICALVFGQAVALDDTLGTLPCAGVFFFFSFFLVFSLWPLYLKPPAKPGETCTRPPPLQFTGLYRVSSSAHSGLCYFIRRWPVEKPSSRFQTGTEFRLVFFLFGYGISSSFRQVVWVQLARDPLWKCVCVFLFFLPSFARLRQSRSRDSACRRSFRWRTQEKGHVMGCRRSFRHRTSRLSFVQPIGFVFGRNGSDCRLQLGSRCARDGVSGLAHRQLLSLFVVALIRSCAKAQRHLKSVYSRGAC